MEAKEVIERLLDIIARHGLPRQILSDQGTQFMGSLMKGLCKHLGIEAITTTPFHLFIHRLMVLWNGFTDACSYVA